MAHIHFAWELGGALGHAGRLKPLAQEALRRGRQVSLSLRDVTQTQALLRDFPAPIFQAPIWLHIVHGIPSPQISLAEVLQGCGYLNADTLRGLLKAWVSLLDSCKPDLVIGDYAPTAMMAAQVLGIPYASIGVGFWLPPPAQPLPNLRDWEGAQSARLQNAEARLLETANTVLVELGAAPKMAAADLFQGQHSFMQTWPEMDHFQRSALLQGQRWWGPAISMQTGMAPMWPEGNGPQVFAYLKAQHPDHVQVLQALAKLGCRTVCYMPEVATGKPAPVVHPLINYATGPVNLDLALRDAKLCVCHAGEGTLAAALLAEVPVFMMPTQGEQFLRARAIEHAGLGTNASARVRPLDYVGLVRPLLGEGPIRSAVQAFAAKYSGFSPTQQAVELMDAFERLAQHSSP